VSLSQKIFLSTSKHDILLGKKINNKSYMKKFKEIAIGKLSILNALFG
jgi:hypothetical protein